MTTHRGKELTPENIWEEYIVPKRKGQPPFTVVADKTEYPNVQLSDDETKIEYQKRKEEL